MSSRKKKKPPSPKPPMTQSVPTRGVSGGVVSDGAFKRIKDRVREWGSSPYVAIIALVLAIVGLPMAWEYYIPDITVNEGVILDPSDVLSSAFQITNTGHFAVRSIEPCIMPDLIEFGNNSSLTGNDHYLCSTSNYFPILQEKETKSLPLNNIIDTIHGGYITEARFRVRIHYRYFFFIPRTQYFRFRTFRGAQGELHLFKEPN